MAAFVPSVARYIVPLSLIVLPRLIEYVIKTESKLADANVSAFVSLAVLSVSVTLVSGVVSSRYVNSVLVIADTSRNVSAP